MEEVKIEMSKEFRKLAMQNIFNLNDIPTVKIIQELTKNENIKRPNKKLALTDICELKYKDSYIKALSCCAGLGYFVIHY